MYQVLDKDTVNKELLPHLSVAKRGYPTKSQLAETVNTFLYKLNTSVQWEYLPIKSLFSEVVPSYKSVFRHFCKWSRKGDWQESRTRILSQHKSITDLSGGDMDGRHTPALLGSEEVAYQARKQENDQCSVFLTDRNGLTLAMTSPVAGKHHDLHNMENKPEELFTGLEKAYRQWI